MWGTGGGRREGRANSQRAGAAGVGGCCCWMKLLPSYHNMTQKTCELVFSLMCSCEQCRAQSAARNCQVYVHNISDR